MMVERGSGYSPRPRITTMIISTSPTRGGTGGCLFSGPTGLSSRNPPEGCVLKRCPLPPVLVLLLLALMSSETLRGWAQTTPALPMTEGFEVLKDGLPAAWTNISAGELAVTLSADSRSPKEGKSSWRIEVGAWDAGSAQVMRRGIPVRAGASYAVEVWMRGRDLDTPVLVTIRKEGGEQTPYLAREFAVGPAWRRCVMEGRCAGDDPAAVLAISFAGTGALNVDALRVVEGELPVEPEPEPPPPIKGNRIYNGSFELGLEGWTIAEQAALVAAQCPDGEKFARWLPNPFALQCRPFLARPGQVYTISAYLRSQRPGALAEIAAIEVGNGARLAQRFDLTSEWRRCSFTVRLPCERYRRYFISLGPADELHGLDIDAVQVEEGALAPFAISADIELAPGLSRAQLFPLPNEVLGIPAQVYAPAKIAADTSLEYRLEGFHGETLTIGRVPLKPGAARAEVPLRVRIPGSGMFRLVLEARVGGTPISAAETNLTALPALDSTPRPDSFFGGHGSVGTPGEWHAPTIASRAGIRWWRLHDLSAYTQWAVAEPEPDRYVWFDREITALRSRGISVLGVFARTAPWAGQDPGGPKSEPTSWPPARMSDFSDYVRQVVAHYRGRIDAYEIWNEPWAREYWAGTPEKYAEMVKAAAQAARAAEPGVKLVGGCFWAPQTGFTDRVLAKGILPSLNAVSHHQYTEPEHVSDAFTGKDQVSQWQQSLRGKLSLVGGEKIPLWNTEGGTSCPSYYSWLGAEEQSRAAARTVAKTLILTRASGVRRYFYYHVWQENGGSRLFDYAFANNWSLLDYDGSGKPALGALGACAQNLDGAAPAGRVETAALKAYVFRRGSETIVALWSPSALVTPLRLRLALDPLLVRAQTVMGNLKGIGTAGAEEQPGCVIQVRNEPVYLHVRDTPPAAVIQALKASDPPPSKKKVPEVITDARPSTDVRVIGTAS